MRPIASQKTCVTEEHFDKTFGLNVRGTLFTVQKALPLVVDGGSIIMNGSMASVKGFPAFGQTSALAPRPRKRSRRGSDRDSGRSSCAWSTFSLIGLRIGSVPRTETRGGS
jgi:NAD(P)-dependent dehydrogenase (short-subunit alcohol dehydrogenase family)